MENKSGVGPAAYKLGGFIVRCAMGEIPESVAENGASCVLDLLGLTVLAWGDGGVHALSSLATAGAARLGTARLSPQPAWHCE